MPELITLPTFRDTRGCLTVLEKVLPFKINRVYWLSDCDGRKRGGHRHFKTYQAAICIHGSCRFTIVKNSIENMYELNNSNQCLLLDPDDWHIIDESDNNAVILMLASHSYDPNDYSTEPLV
jgi:dTDP-4-dehydrorhamnose 3,5-epimerase-like enzyme